MGFKKNNPGCNCCGTCSVCADTFDLANGSDIGTDTVCGWTASTGTWDINSNTLRCTSAGIVVCNTSHPTSAITTDIQVTIKHSNSGSTCDIIVSRLNNNNYFYARYTFSGASGSVAIRQVSGGTDSAINTKSSVTLTTATNYAARVCVQSNGMITAYLDGTPQISGIPFATPLGTGIGLACSGAGTATFDAWTLAKSYNSSGDTSCYECTPAFDCNGACTAQSGPSSFQVVMSGITNGTCTSCSSYNATFVCALSAASVGGCRWEYVFPSAVCSITPGDRETMQVFMPYISMVLAVGPSVNNGFQSYFRDITGPYTCNTISSLALTYFFSNGGCTASGGSCVISAL